MPLSAALARPLALVHSNHVEGVDCASSTLGHAAALAQAGIHFACRYVSTPGNPKNLTRAEADALTAAGLGIVVVFETSAQRALSGRPGGVRDAKAALEQATACGMPKGRPIYFAVDLDATTGQEAAIHSYLSGAASVLGHSATGVYGGLDVVRSALDAGVCAYAWQTYAWSGGRWDERAHLQQYSNGQSVAGLSVDLDHATAADYGQWHPPATRRLAGYTISYIDAKGHRATVDVQTRARLGQRQPEHWQRHHHVVHTRGKVIITRRFTTDRGAA